MAAGEATDCLLKVMGALLEKQMEKYILLVAFWAKGKVPSLHLLKEFY